MIKYPIGIQSFEQLREDGYVYVDKTALVHKLATTGKIFLAVHVGSGKACLCQR